jgi:hypothetical protein
MNSIGIHPHKFIHESLYTLPMKFMVEIKNLDEFRWIKLNSS